MTLATLIDNADMAREAWKYTSLKPLAGMDFQPATERTLSIDRLPSILPDAADRHRLVFVDGFLRRDLALLGGLPSDIIGGDADHGYDLALSTQTCLALAPLELLFITTSEDRPVTSAVDLRIRVGASGRLTLVEHHLSLGGNVPHAALHNTQIELADHAKLVHARLQASDPNHYHFAQTEVRVAAGAYYDSFALTRGALLSRDEIHVRLSGEEAQCQLNGLYALRGAQHADTLTVIEHAAANCNSRQVYKGVLEDRARGVFQGKIKVHQDAQRTDGHQLCRMLLLSDVAEADIKPELEIHADDVKCSHGATVGQLDEDALFYLRARGIPSAEARGLLIRAFLDEVIDDLDVPMLRDSVHKDVAAWLEKKS